MLYRIHDNIVPSHLTIHSPEEVRCNDIPKVLKTMQCVCEAILKELVGTVIDGLPMYRDKNVVSTPETVNLMH